MRKIFKSISEMFCHTSKFAQLAPQGPTGPQGARGDAGVGIKSITGRVEVDNTLVLIFTLTDGRSQLVKGSITPPSAG